MCTFRADFVLKAFLKVLHLNDFLRVLFSAAMSDILTARKSKVLVEFLPATFFVCSLNRLVVWVILQNAEFFEAGESTISVFD